MDKIKSFLNLLNGKKTAIGFILLFTASIVGVYFSGSGQAIPDWLGGIKAVLEYAGYAIGGTGIVHKATKGELAQ